MRSLKILFLCLCLFSSFAFAEGVGSSEHQPPVNKTTVQSGFPNIFRPIGDFFKRLFEKKRRIVEYPFPSVENLTLSRTEVSATCSLNNKYCSNIKPIIEVLAKGHDWDGEEVVYKYKVSDGQIIGSGSKVVWDLSNLKPGVYKITASADDPCGGCGKNVTKEVTVVECPDCR